MKFTLSWLKEYLETDATLDEICDKLTFIGLEVEEVVDSASVLEPFKAVYVKNVKKHPDSDHLKVCDVEVAGGEVLQVICGAPNAKSGMKAVFAPIGSVIPTSGLKIKKSKILGVESCGMLCSGKELGLSEEADGIIELDADVELGKTVSEIFGLDDPVVEINITPNRGDCLGVYGIARDLCASGLGKLKELKLPKIDAKFKSPINLKVTDKDTHCFAGRYIRGVKNCESPDWMKKRLMAIGLTPISALVDITNYVLFTYGKPLHVYDAKKIKGDLVVRKAKNSEKFIALDGDEYELDDDVTVITDAKEVLGIGGIMGGLNSGSQMETTDVFLESAMFDVVNVAKSGRKLWLESDSRYRFERGIDHDFVVKGLDIATDLVLSICGGEASEMLNSCKVDEKSRTLDFRFDKIKQVLGVEVDRKEVLRILGTLGFGLTEDAKDLNILHLEIPSWRNDVSIEEDIIEEIARIYGYDNLDSIEIPLTKIDSQKEDEEKSNKMWQVKQKLSAKGLDEVISWAFIREDLAGEFVADNPKMKVINPISNDLEYMRPSLIPNLLSAIVKNNARGYKNLNLFEIGKIYLGSNPEEQENVIAGMRFGKTADKNIYHDERKNDIFDVKKDLMDVLEIFGFDEDSVQISRDAPDYYHPQRSGSVRLGKNVLGCFGEVHPVKTKAFDIKDKVNVFELYLENLPVRRVKSGTARSVFDVSDLQAVTRDFSFILDKDIDADKLRKLARGVNKELIESVNLFDVYEGENIGADKKSVAFNIVIQPKIKTMTSEEIDAISDAVVGKIVGELGGVLRDG